MRKTYSLLSLLCLSLISTLQAQQLYMPRNIKQAYANNTRSATGLPGKYYWQNKGLYNIAFTVNTQAKTVSGTETITYYNNSPDELKSIALRFVNNIHKPGAPRSGAAATDYLTSGLHIKSLSYNGRAIQVNSTHWGTVESIALPAPIKARDSASFTIAWEYPLSKLSGREGQIDSATLYCAYAYPRISVYDDYNGWDMLPHTDGQEFYNDFNDYTYSVTAPANWLVWGTGQFLNPKEVLSPMAYKRYTQAAKSSARVPIATAADVQAGTVTARGPLNTWRFAIKHVTDVCFALSSHYLWDAASVQLKSHRVMLHAAYSPRASADFGRYTQWLNHNITWYSNNFPGVDYPFPSMTAVQGFANMEYPGMVNDETVENLFSAQKLADHEVAHSYFPFYMGTNETRYAFMDEGWAVVMEYLIGKATFGAARADSAFSTGRVGRWIKNNAAEEDQPIITMSTQLSGTAYRNNSYGKAALSYLALKDMLGDALFKKALHYYMDAWHGKHPSPWDYFNCMSAGSGQNLNWFFQNWFFTNNYSDLTLAAAQHSPSGLNLQVRNTGGFAIPFNVELTYKNGTRQVKHYSPAVWHSSPAILKLQLPLSGPLASVTINNGIYMDANPADNTRQL